MRRARCKRHQNRWARQRSNNSSSSTSHVVAVCSFSAKQCRLPFSLLLHPSHLLSSQPAPLLSFCDLPVTFCSLSIAFSSASQPTIFVYHRVPSPRVKAPVYYHSTINDVLARAEGKYAPAAFYPAGFILLRTQQMHLFCLLG